MKRTGFRTRAVPLRAVPFPRTAGPGAGPGLQRGTRIRRVSVSRAAENRQRRKIARSLFPEQPRCAVPWCTLMADDVHETLTRARSGGAIADPGIWKPACRGHNGELTLEPKWGYDLGLLHHSWDDPAAPPPGAITREAAALLFARDRRCVHCGGARTLRPWLRQENGEHQGCVCGWVLTCPRCQDRAAFDRTGEFADEGLIIPGPAVPPYLVAVAVHLEDDRGGMRKFATCDGRWADEQPAGVAS